MMTKSPPPALGQRRRPVASPRIARPRALLIVAFTGGGGMTLPPCGASGWALPAIIGPGRGRAETANSPKGEPFSTVRPARVLHWDCLWAFSWG